MRQIVRLRLPPVAYPDAAAALDRAECALPIATRRWAGDFRHRVDPLPQLCRTMDSDGVHTAAVTRDQPITVLGPRFPALSNKVTAMFNADSLVQASDNQRAERALRTALLSAPGAEFALAPWQGLADLFAGALLFFRRSRLFGRDPAPLQAARPWITPTISNAIQ